MNYLKIKFAPRFFIFFLLLQPFSIFAEDVELDAILFESSELMQSGEVAASLALLKRAEQKHANSREFLNNLAVAYLGNSQPEEALSILRQLVDNDPLYNIIAHNLLEMELQINETRPEKINPVLFTQTVDSFFVGEVSELQQPETKRAGIPSETDIPIQTNSTPANPNLIPPSNNSANISSQQQVQHSIIAKAVLSNWSSSWASKNYSAYISIYSSDFISSKGLNYSAWLENRKWALKKPGNITINTSKMETTSLSADQIVVIFDQAYSSSNYNDKVQKEITLVRENADWKILKEITLKTY